MMTPVISACLSAIPMQCSLVEIDTSDTQGFKACRIEMQPVVDMWKIAHPDQVVSAAYCAVRSSSTYGLVAPFSGCRDEDQMFTVVLSVCLLVEPNACTTQPANLPIQETFSDCLDAANAEAVLFKSLHPERMIALI